MSLHVEPHQARRRAPTQYEDLLGDALERAFAAGLHEIPPLIEYLNRSGPLGPNGAPWTPASFEATLTHLSEQP